MKFWIRVTLNDRRVLGGSFHRLCRGFQQAFIAAGAPRGMAMFAIVEGDQRSVYFSPESLRHVQELVEHHEGEPCDVPDSRDLTMIFGVPGADADIFGASEAPAGDGAAAPVTVAR